MLPYFVCLLLVIAGIWAFKVWVSPVLEIRDTLRRLSDGDTRPVVLGGKVRFYREQFRQLDYLASRLKDMGQQIQEEGFSLRAILRSMVEGVVIADPGLRIRLANDALSQMFHLETTPIDRMVLEIFKDSSLQKTMQDALEGTPARQVFGIETLVDGRYVKKFFEVHAVALMPANASKPAGVLAVFHDVTETRALEVMREELIVNVSHELRTPLAIIKGYVETLLDGALENPALAEKFLRIMLKHGERLDLLIEDLLNLSRLESGSAALQLESVNLHGCVETVIARLAPRIQQGNAEVRLEFPEDLPEVIADIHRLDQVFSNLLENALKYAPSGTAKIQVSARNAGSNIEVHIEDNGPGIPMADQPHIFERFYRVQKDRNRDEGGTGLGLSIVKHILQLHGGKVWVNSVPGKSCIFGFSLPIEGPALAESDGLTEKCRLSS